MACDTHNAVAFELQTNSEVFLNHYSRVPGRVWDILTLKQLFAVYLKFAGTWESWMLAALSGNLGRAGPVPTPRTVGPLVSCTC